MYDVLRSDKTISSCGLEPRTPFLDRSFVQYYLSLTPMLRCHNIYNICEKYLIRKAYSNKNVLPDEVLWRTKEAFSDGVSKQTRSWYQIIQEHVSKIITLPQSVTDNKVNNQTILYKNIPIFTSSNTFMHNTPTSQEQLFYRSIFEYYYPNCGRILPYFWMPKYVDAKDSSARTLDLYKTKMGIKSHSVKSQQHTEQHTEQHTQQHIEEYNSNVI
jgi:asparagine synthase (glutamine-hydrolysing)